MCNYVYKKKIFKFLGRNVLQNVYRRATTYIHKYKVFNEFKFTSSLALINTEFRILIF